MWRSRAAAVAIAVAERVAIVLAESFTDPVSEPLSVGFADRVAIAEWVGDSEREPSAGLPIELLPETRRELEDLAQRFGRPVMVDAMIDDSFKDPIWKRDRFGEVCMVIRRRSGGLLLSIKTFYPRGAFRLPTGGIHHGEGIYDALVRETHEETGLVTTVERFLARIAYRPLSRPGAPPVFHTFAFLLDEVRGTLGALDENERIEAWKEIRVADLSGIADGLDDLKTQGVEDIGGDWRAWGKFRAVVHRAVHEALGTNAER